MPFSCRLNGHDDERNETIESNGIGAAHQNVFVFARNTPIKPKLINADNDSPHRNDCFSQIEFLSCFLSFSSCRSIYLTSVVGGYLLVQRNSVCRLVRLTAQHELNAKHEMHKSKMVESAQRARERIYILHSEFSRARGLSPSLSLAATIGRLAVRTFALSISPTLAVRSQLFDGHRNSACDDRSFFFSFGCCSFVVIVVVIIMDSGTSRWRQHNAY